MAEEKSLNVPLVKIAKLACRYILSLSFFEFCAVIWIVGVVEPLEEPEELLVREHPAKKTVRVVIKIPANIFFIRWSVYDTIFFQDVKSTRSTHHGLKARVVLRVDTERSVLLRIKVRSLE